MTDHDPLAAGLTGACSTSPRSAGSAPAGAPALVDPDAGDDRRVVITDDFGQRIQMSLAQLAMIVDDARNGVLDGLLADAT